MAVRRHPRPNLKSFKPKWKGNDEAQRRADYAWKELKAKARKRKRAAIHQFQADFGSLKEMAAKHQLAVEIRRVGPPKGRKVPQVIFHQGDRIMGHWWPTSGLVVLGRSTAKGERRQAKSADEALQLVVQGAGQQRKWQ